MKIVIELSKDDWLKFQKYLSKDIHSSVNRFSDNLLLNVVFWLVLVFIFMQIIHHYDEIHMLTAGYVSAIVLCLAIWMILKNRKFLKAYQPKSDGAFVGTHNFEFDKQGIHSYGKNYDARHSWDMVQEIRRESAMIMIFIDTAMAFIFPEEKLNDPDDFYRAINEMFESSKLPKSSKP